MKKIINIIIITIFFFSSFKYTFAQEGYMEKLLDLNYGVEEHKIEITKLESIYFNNPEFSIAYDELRGMDRVLKDEFLKKYRNGEYTYYQINGIITSYNKFIYHANKFFNLLKIEEQNPDYEEIDKAILNSYTNMRSSFRKVKNIVKNIH